MSGPTTNYIDIMQEKETARAVQIEDVGEAHAYEAAEAIASQYNAYVLTLLIPSTTLSLPQLISFAMISLELGDEYKDDIGCAVGLARTFRLLGSSIAITNNTFSNHLPEKMERATPGFSNMSAFVKAGALNTEAAYKAVPGITVEIITAAQLAVKYAYVEAYKTTYLSALGFGGAAIIAACFTMSTDKRMKNDKRIVRLENENGKIEEALKIDIA